MTQCANCETTLDKAGELTFCDECSRWLCADCFGDDLYLTCRACRARERLARIETAPDPGYGLFMGAGNKAVFIAHDTPTRIIIAILTLAQARKFILGLQEAIEDAQSGKMDSLTPEVIAKKIELINRAEAAHVPPIEITKTDKMSNAAILPVGKVLALIDPVDPDQCQHMGRGVYRAAWSPVNPYLPDLELLRRTPGITLQGEPFPIDHLTAGWMAINFIVDPLEEKPDD